MVSLVCDILIAVQLGMRACEAKGVPVPLVFATTELIRVC